MDRTRHLVTVSVIIPVYNGAAFVGSALASVFSQTRPADEVIVVDDASTDDSAAVVEAIARKAPLPIRLIRLAVNSGGPAKPMNCGIEAARGEFIAVLDQDDVFLPRRLELLVPVMQTDPDLSFVFSLVGRIGAPGRLGIGGLPAQQLRRLTAQLPQGISYKRLSGSAALRMMVAHGNLPIGYPGLLFRRSAWEKKGGLDQTLRVCSDYDMVCWLCSQGPVAFVPRTLSLRCFHGGNLSLSSLEGWIEAVRVIRRYAPCAWPTSHAASFQADLRRHFLWMLVGAGLVGRHGAGTRLLWSAVDEWGLSRDSVLTAAKLLFTWDSGGTSCGEVHILSRKRSRHG